MARKRDPNSRRAKAERRRLAKGLTERVEPNKRVMELRDLFSFVTPSKGPDGRVGEIDQDVCDPLGQLHALGLLDNDWHDATELRDKGRFWGCHYARLLRGLGVKMGSYERRSKGQENDPITGADLMFDRMDGNLERFERQVLLSLIVDPIIGHEETVLWAQAHISEALWQRGKIPPLRVFKTANDVALLDTALRGLIQLVDATAKKIAA